MAELRVGACVFGRDGEIAETGDELPVYVPGTGLDVGTGTLHWEGAAVWISDVGELVKLLSTSGVVESRQTGARPPSGRG